MGQRSQIYVSYINASTGKRELMARYFHWNYGSRMISRARYTMEWLKGYVIDEKHNSLYDENITKLSRIIDTNFDYKDVCLSIDIINEINKTYNFSNERETKERFYEDVFFNQANNDGKLFIDVDDKGEIKYAFITDTNNQDYGEHIVDAEQYLIDNAHIDEDEEKDNYLKLYFSENNMWKGQMLVNYSAEEIVFTESNVEWINTNVSLMSKDELNNFLARDYSNITID